MNQVMNDICSNWSFVSNHQSNDDGRIILIWKQSVSVFVLHQDRQMMTCRVCCPGTVPFLFTAVYASSIKVERDTLWKDLTHIHSQLQIGSFPWLLGGDFNEILHHNEHSSPDKNQLTTRMVNFKACLETLEVKDLRYHGPLFSWSNKRPEKSIAKKLDRALINEHWFRTYPSSLASFLAPGISDHTPCLISLNSTLPQTGTKPFKFFNFLVDHPDFLTTVASSWVHNEKEGYSLRNMSVKQRQLRRELKTLNKNNFSEIQKRVGEANRFYVCVGTLIASTFNN